MEEDNKEITVEGIDLKVYFEYKKEDEFCQEYCDYKINIGGIYLFDSQIDLIDTVSEDFKLEIENEIKDILDE